MEASSVPDREGERRGRRIGLGILLALLLVVEVQAFSIVLAGQDRTRDAAMADLRTALVGILPRLAIDLTRRPAADVLREARETLPDTAAAALFDPEGRTLAASQGPGRAVTVEPPDESLRRRLSVAGRLAVVGPFAGGRVFLYGAVRRPNRRPVVLGVSKVVPALEADLRERHLLVALHGGAIGLLLLGGLVAAAGLSRPGLAPGAAAMAAYEAAMAQLADRGRQDARRHATELQLLHETLESHEAMARAGELASGIVHEVRNGLGTITGYARFAAKAAGEGREPSLDDALRGILEECASLETVVRRFSEFVRTETLRQAPVDLRRLCERIVARLQRARPLPEVTFAGTCALLDADEDLLERALDNLIRNAREAAGDEGHVDVRLSDQAGWARLEIEDDGPGLAPALKDGIRPFLSTKPGGLGLGLATAIKLVKLHGGNLSLEPSAPHGLTVVVGLPRKGADGVGSVTDSSDTEARSDSGPRGGDGANDAFKTD
jgi:signal transduction histidine kinase